MMLDKDQIGGWEGEPERKHAKPVVRAAQQQQAAMAAEPPHEAPQRQSGGAGEARATGEHVILTPEQKQARKRRSQWTALALFAFVILVFVITMARLGGGIPERI